MKARMQDNGLFLQAENEMEARALAKLTLDQHAHSMNIDGQNLSINEVDTGDSEEHDKARADAAFAQFKNDAFAQGRSEYLQGKQPATPGSPTARQTGAGSPNVASPTTSFGAPPSGVPSPNIGSLGERGSFVGGTPSAANPTGVPQREVGESPEAYNTRVGSYRGGATSPGFVNRSAESTANAADTNENVTGQTTEAQNTARNLNRERTSDQSRSGTNVPPGSGGGVESTPRNSVSATSESAQEQNLNKGGTSNIPEGFKRS